MTFADLKELAIDPPEFGVGDRVEMAHDVDLDLAREQLGVGSTGDVQEIYQGATGYWMARVRFTEVRALSLIASRFRYVDSPRNDAIQLLVALCLLGDTP
jgi:hypothetical protein